MTLTVKVWYPAILAHYKARRYGLKDYYRRLQIGLPGALSNNSTSTSTSISSKAGDEVDTGSLPPKVQRALDLGRKHKFEHPLGVKSTRRYSAGFDDCECIISISVSGPVRSFVLASIDPIFFARSVGLTYNETLNILEMICSSSLFPPSHLIQMPTNTNSTNSTNRQMTS